MPAMPDYSNESVNIASNRPGVTKVAVLYVVIAVIAMSTAAAVFYLLLRREAESIKDANGGFVDACASQ